MVFRHLPIGPEAEDVIGARTSIVVSTCSPERCEVERRAARVALAAAYAREAALVRRFEAMVDHADHPEGRCQPVLTREVNEVLEARDWALARLDEWSG